MATRIKTKSNKGRRTFTIREYLNGELILKFRTYPMTPEAFQSCSNKTEQDWRHFLQLATSEYYRIR